MKKNIYYTTMFGRPNMIKQFILGLFLSLSYWFRIPIEMLIRKNFGERYFNLLLSVVIGIIFLGFPIFYMNDLNSRPTFAEAVLTFSTWYIYSFYYCYCVYKRWDEVAHEPSVFDFAKFSMSTGDFLEIIKLIRKPDGMPFNSRTVQIYIEPGAFFIGGVILALFQQPLGYLFISCAVVYSLGYEAAFHLGDNFMMDQIDEMLCNQDLADAFIHDEPSPSGIPIYGERPTSTEMRERLFNRIVGDDGDEEDDAIDVS